MKMTVRIARIDDVRTLRRSMIALPRLLPFWFGTEGDLVSAEHSCAAVQNQLALGFEHHDSVRLLSSCGGAHHRHEEVTGSEECVWISRATDRQHVHSAGAE